MIYLLCLRMSNIDIVYLLKFFFVNSFFSSHIFSFRFVFGDYPTTGDTLSTVPNNARKFPFITDVLR